MGTRGKLRTGVWVEAKAVRHYAELLAAVEWDAETRAVIEKDQADEAGHIARWEGLLREDAPIC
jgi:ubiquinone biosynthesis monooxygenase Coq7